MIRKKRVLLLGFYHETHTLLPTRTPWEAFICLKGPEIFGQRGSHSPIDGFLEAAEGYGWEVVPTVDARAMPSGLVDDDVLERVWHLFFAELEKSGPEPIDGIFLVLHGAMVSSLHRDMEGELLARIRGVPALSTVPVFGVVDLHANFSKAMANLANGLLAYRKNPHTDAWDTSIRAAALLNRVLEGKGRSRMLWEHSNIILPPLATSTDIEPMRTLLDLARELEADHPSLLAVNILAGFAYADTEDAGLSFSMIVDGPAELEKQRMGMLQRTAWSLRNHACIEVPPPQAVFDSILPVRDGPLVIVEVSDNIGAGTFGDSTGLVREFLRRDVGRGVITLNDPEAVDTLKTVPTGSRVKIRAGGKVNPYDPGPVTINAILKHKSNGRFQLEDPQSHLASMTGWNIEMGECAVLEQSGLTILLTSRSTPPFDLGQLRSQGIEPESMDCIGVKAAVGHQYAYGPISRGNYWVETPGPCPTDLRGLSYVHLKRPIFPIDA